MEIAQVPDAFSSKLLRFYTAGTEGAKGTCMRRSYIVADMAHPSGYAIYDQVAVRIGSCASQDSGFGQVQPSGSSAKDASYALAAIAAAQSGRQASGDPVYQFQCHEHADCRQLVGDALKRINLRRLRLLERSAGGMWSLTFGSEKKGGVPSTFDVDCRSARCTISLASTSPAPF
ncbi:hypothetical protein KV697_11135 [Sphingomonas sanguinis]|uniref:hypothetical protein n=1 Tax=Sphingomonas sanguinis TaxID=33051 RepID=UPI001C56184D|nr:hypothetical protein [Sphingomonas sanguinis]QXT34380.1 hypothetical protein KV697_11135 [Sphingomonas sanguinis]